MRDSQPQSELNSVASPQGSEGLWTWLSSLRARPRDWPVTLLLLAPGLATFFGLFFYPFAITVVMSLHPEGQTTGWTVQNYLNFLGDPHGREVIGLTFLLALSTTFLSILLSVPLSLILRGRVRGHRFFRAVPLVPLVIPGMIGALGLLLLFGNRGWFNLFLRDVFGLGTPVAVNYTIYGLIIFYVWLYFPYTFLTTISTLEALDPGIEEAAQVSGADRWQVLRYVVLPLIAPGILAGSVLTFMSAFGAFNIPLIAGGNYRPLAVEVYKQIQLYIPARWSQASAMAVIMGILQAAFLSFYMRFLRRKTV
jgi:putative spermidine/putrescine transport system permease protein